MADHLHAWAKREGQWFCEGCGVEYGKHAFQDRYVVLGDRQQAVYDVLADGHWHDGPELTHPAAGGSEGLRRLRELRAKGYTIEMRLKAKGKTTRQYRLVG